MMSSGESSSETTIRSLMSAVLGVEAVELDAATARAAIDLAERLTTLEKRVKVLEGRSYGASG